MMISLEFFPFSDVPRVRLELGRNLEGDSIREGIDVYFDCHVTARPSAVRLVWRHQVFLSLFFFLGTTPSALPAEHIKLERERERKSLFIVMMSLLVIETDPGPSSNLSCVVPLGRSAPGRHPVG